ncbi:MAG: ATP-binding protein [Vulcanimicrobiaceae bacterium]
MSSAYGVDERVSFVGRTELLKQIGAELGTGGILTLVGPGGVGKSRLALEAARSWCIDNAAEFSFVSLATVNDDGVARAILEALETREEPRGDPLDLACDVARRRRTLLVLDNCEHVRSAVELAASRLSKYVPVLATSRHLLEADAERAIAVPPFDVDEGTEFFLRRARMAGAPRQLDEASFAIVREIVQTLDGLAIAIDIAASWLSTLTFDELKRKLADPETLLWRFSAQRDPRHWTLSAVIDWSCTLLTREAVQIFAIASLFAGVFTPDDVAAVAQAQTNDVAMHLRKLNEHSLLTAVTGESRYRMLLPIRTDAQRRFEQLHGHERYVEQFVNTMLAVSESVRLMYEGTNSVTALGELSERYADLCAALEWSIEHKPGSAVPIAAALVALWSDGGRFSEGLRWMERLMQIADRLDAGSRATLLYAMIRVAYPAGEYGRILEIAPQLIDAYSRTNDRLGLARAHNAAGIASFHRNRIAEAETHLHTAIGLYESLCHQRGICSALVNLGCVALEARTDGDSASRYYGKALAIAREAGPTTLVITNLGNLAEVAYCEGDPERAEAFATEGLAECIAQPNEPLEAWLRLIVTRTRIALGDPEQARASLSRALELLERQPNSEYVATAAEAAAAWLLTEQRIDDAALAAALALRYRTSKGIVKGGPFGAEALRTRAAIAERLNAASLRQTDGLAAGLGSSQLPTILLAFIREPDPSIRQAKSAGE